MKTFYITYGDLKFIKDPRVDSDLRSYLLTCTCQGYRQIPLCLFLD